MLWLMTLSASNGNSGTVLNLYLLLGRLLLHFQKGMYLSTSSMSKNLPDTVLVTYSLGAIGLMTRMFSVAVFPYS